MTSRTLRASKERHVWRAVRCSAAVVVAAVSALTGCTIDSDSSDAAVVGPWDEPTATWMQPAGTAMVNGVAVPEGAELVGPVFSSVANTRDGEWKVLRQSAFLLAPTGIEEIAQDLADQAAPPKLVPLSNGGLCIQNIAAVEGFADTQEYHGDVLANAVDVECGGYQRSGPGFEFSLRQEMPQDSAWIQGHLRWFSPNDALPPSRPELPEGVDGQ